VNNHLHDYDKLVMSIFCTSLIIIYELFSSIMANWLSSNIIITFCFLVLYFNKSCHVVTVFSWHVMVL